MPDQRWVRLALLVAMTGLLASQCMPAATGTPKVVLTERATAHATPRRIVAPTASPTPEPKRTPTGKVVPVRIAVVYDNNAYDPRLQMAWGFAGLIERGDMTILFDTGGDGSTLLSNLETLDLDPRDVDIIVLSHIHGDHTGGLGSLLATGVQPTVFVPRSFPDSFKAQVRARTALVEVHEITEIADGVYTTGEMGTSIVEQGLVLRTPKGLVVITGCAHPGIAEMVRRAKEVVGGEVHLVLGGFHLGGAREAGIKDIIADFRRLGVQKVAPCHCTGDKAIGLFREAYGEDFIQNGAGKVLVFD